MWESYCLHLDLYHSPTLIHFITMVLVLLMECLVPTFGHLLLDFEIVPPEQPMAGSAHAI